MLLRLLLATAAGAAQFHANAPVKPLVLPRSPASIEVPAAPQLARPDLPILPAMAAESINPGAAPLAAAPAGPAQARPQKGSPERQSAEAASAFDGSIKPSEGEGFDLPIETFQLPNGLTVVVQPDHSSPTTAVSLTYRVGSQDERPGLSGFAHLFEHLMAQGTKSLKPREITTLISAAGGERNASTSRTRTNYYSVVPRGALELVLWAEAERMHLLNVDGRALTQEKNVVTEEMRKNYLNQPYALAQGEVLSKTAFTRWENQHTTIGDIHDVRGASLDDVHAFYRAHYAPNNAVIAIAGDVTPQDALALVTKYFAAIPPAPAAPRPDLSEPPLEGERRAVAPDPLAKVPRLLMAWHAPERGSKDFWALTVLREILSGDEASPLYRELVKTAKAALDVGIGFPYFSDAATTAGPDLFLALAIPRPGVPETVVKSAVDSFLAKLAESGPAQADMKRAVAQLRLSWLHKIQNVEDRANLLSAYGALVGDPKRLFQDLAEASRVTAEDVRQAAKRWLADAGRAVVWVEPAPQAPAAERLPELTVPEASPRPAGDAPPAVAKAESAPLPVLHRLTLSNGLDVVLIQDKRLPLVEARLSIKTAGAVSEGPADNGLSDAAADLLLKGAGAQDAAAIASELARLGYDLSVAADLERLRVTASGLSANVEPFLAKLAALLSGARYPREELSLWQEQVKENLKNERVKPGFMTGERLKAELFPGHPYGRPAASEAEIDSLTPERLRAFKDARIVPSQATLVLAGDFDAESARPMLERALGGWKGRAERPEIPALAEGASARLAFIDRPGSKQVNLTIAQTAPLTPADGDFMALAVANSILGGGAQGRLFLNLRVKNAYTYGAYSSLQPRAATTLWSAAAETRADVAQAALDEMRKEISRLREEPVDAQLLEDTKRYLAGAFLMQLSSEDGVASFVSSLLQQGRDPKEVFEGYLKRLNALTPQDVQDAARRYLDPRRMVTVAVGDPKELPAPLR